MSDGLQLNHNPYVYETLGKFFDSKAFIQYIIGPAGSGKTYEAAWKLLTMALMQEPAEDGNRYYRILVVRNTSDILKTATLVSFENSLGRLLQPPFTTKRTAPYIDLTTVIPMPTAGNNQGKLIIYWLFRAFDSEESVKNALGFEYSSMFIDEVSEISFEVFTKIILRIGRYKPSGSPSPTRYAVLAATNGSANGHFLEDWAEGKQNKLMDDIGRYITHPKMFEGFRQPEALIPPEYDWTVQPIDAADWKPNPKAENVDNLPTKYGAYFAMLISDVGTISRYVLGRRAPKMNGALVFPGFSHHKHIVPRDYVDRKSLKHIMLSFDYGLTPCCLIAVATSKGRLLVIDEVVTERSSIDGLVRDHLLPLLKREYSNPSYEFATGDPTGEIPRDVGELKSPEQVLREYGIEYSPPPCGNNLSIRLEGVRQALARGDVESGRDLQVTDNCMTTIQAFSEEYIFPRVAGRISDKPTKAHPWSDVMDCLQYMVSSFYTLQAEAVRSRTRKDRLARERMFGLQPIARTKKGKYL